jgi:hypothetical protein
VTLLHVLRRADDAEALKVISEQIGQGVDVAVLLLSGGEAPAVDAPCHAVGAADPDVAVDWAGAVKLIFEAGRVVTW